MINLEAYADEVEDSEETEMNQLAEKVSIAIEGMGEFMRQSAAHIHNCDYAGLGKDAEKCLISLDEETTMPEQLIAEKAPRDLVHTVVSLRFLKNEGESSKPCHRVLYVAYREFERHYERTLAYLRETHSHIVR